MALAGGHELSWRLNRFISRVLGREAHLPVFSLYVILRSLSRQSGREAAVKESQMTFQSDWLSQYHDGVEFLFSLSSRTEPARPGYADGVVGHVYLQYARHRPDEECVYSAGVPKPSHGPGNSMMGLVAAETTETNADRAAKASKPTDMRGSMRAVGGKPCDRLVQRSIL